MMKAIVTSLNEYSQYLLQSVTNVQHVRRELINARLGVKKLEYASAGSRFQEEELGRASLPSQIRAVAGW